MVVRLMTQFTPIFFRSLSAALLFSTALGGAALAQSLPDIAPETIANDVESRYDERTGQTEYVAGSFDPFEGEDTLAGSASLRSAQRATAINGAYVSGGALLDVSVIYTANSADSYDVRGFEGARFHSGQPVNVIFYDRETLDCTRDTHTVSYDDSYYRGASYGYIGGIYRLFPRYRGHRNFDWRGGHWQRGNWRRAHSRTGRDEGWGRRHGLPDNGDVTRRRRAGDDGDTRRRRPAGNDGDTRRRRPRDGGGNVTRRRDTGSDVTPRRPRRDSDVTPRRPRDGGTSRRTRKAAESSQPTVYRRPPNLADAVGRPARTSKPDRPRRRPTPPSSSGNSVKSVTAPVSRPQRKSRPTPVSRPRPSKPQVNRTVDKTFERKNPRESSRRNKHRNFYPSQYTRTEVQVSYRCLKEEKLTLHIPQERLDAARFDGFAVILIDNSGREVPVFVPPNYVEGFRQAAGMTKLQSSYSSSSPSPVYQLPESSAPARSSREPIIYGDPG